MEPKDTYTDDEFWNECPQLESADGINSIDGVCYEQDDETGDWNKIDW